jgi:hypothetical protein
MGRFEVSGKATRLSIHKIQQQRYRKSNNLNDVELLLGQHPLQRLQRHELANNALGSVYRG